MKKKFLSLLILPFFTTAIAVAAPHPGTSSSPLVSSDTGLFFQSLGFKLSTKGTNWKIQPTKDDSFIQNIVLGPQQTNSTVTATGSAADKLLTESSNKENPQLNIRTDTLDKKISLENYSKKWMRDYSNFGFETLGQQMIQLGGGKALVVDLVQKKQGKQLRQIILNFEQKVAVLTCVDDKSSFETTLKSCNQIARSFEWMK